jgi:ADP-ribose pyrophosphatase YjhB (NUDIX family)
MTALTSSIHRRLEELKAIAQSGLTYTTEPYERERYEQLAEAARALTVELTGWDRAEVDQNWISETGYATPKVDVRGIVFRDNKILLCRERVDGRWSVPGGWTDVGLSPAENALKELREESGFECKIIKLIAVYDRDKHPHPKSLMHIYKIYFLCEIVGGEAATSYETTGVDFFPLDALPELSTPRITKEQIFRAHEHFKNKNIAPDFD